MELKSAFKYKERWKSMRQALYGELSDEFNQEEMALIANDKANRESFIVYDNNMEIGLLEMSLRNFVDGCLSSPVAYVEGVYVNCQFRNKGYGRKVIQEAIKWAKGRGCIEIASDSELGNLNAQLFHKSVGFKETYRIVQYKLEI